MSLLVAIHQPNFFPWLGYFHKLARADVFVFLDDAQFSKGERTNRVELRIGGERRWVTAPVVRAAAAEIREVETDERQNWRRRLEGTITAAYGRAPAFQECFPELRKLVYYPESRIAVYNRHAIEALARRVGLRTQLTSSSEFRVASTGTQRLVEIVQAIGGTAYLSGRGADNYLDEGAFDRAGIKLRYVDYEPRAYPQRDDAFVPGLSVLDALLECGWKRLAELIDGG